ncbi:MAG TPA: GTP-binding protein [Bacteroidales bacterium]|jgi:sulfate adenylyltransferase subunit 1|nr:GTP-binding protein [Bacteroidales bacterium]
MKAIESSKSLLRFTTAGSVDDGKSTLIGRLLYDSKSIFEDQLEQITQSGKRLGRVDLDLSLLTDGLRAEREQGITIDVAYRYFATPARKFIIADTPGHIQYTRNMVTGASTADVAVILVDARNGVLEQTIRHSYIAALLDIRNIIYCINKMDLISWSQEGFEVIKNGLKDLAANLGIHEIHFIPISAKYGDNVVSRSVNMGWYHGPTFLSLLETIEIEPKNSGPARFPVQTVIRADSHKYPDYRAVAGKMASGTFKKGDEVIILPSMLSTRIKNINNSGTEINECSSGDCVSIVLEDQVDTGRGDMLVSQSALPQISDEIDLVTCWFNSRPLNPGARYVLRINNIETKCIIKSVNYRININTLERDYENQPVKMNDIAHISVKTSRPVFFDQYKTSNMTGNLIFIDESTHETTGAGMIQER